ncbi:GntR family transcriptional regulator [Thermocrispum municipale]|uniref:GntR family transcriptional regulator n=1 Tax=Thermocrispum municipale TaxID=37926 RepID=UPI00048C6A2C|nr:GntR family transcriptional regulator [Thermocrispum municipale]
MPMSSGWSAVPAQRVSSLRSHVEKTLSAAIISGQLKPGDMLTVPTLAAEFEVSATPVREALLDLASRGLVAPVRNKGFRVTEVSEEQAQHIADIRMLLEPPAMRRLAEAFDASKEPEVRALADKIVQGARDGDIKSYLESDVEFHGRLTGMLGNPMLTDIVTDLRTRTRLSNLERLAASGKLEASAAEHHELLDALVARDAERAEAVMRRHIGHTVGIWAGKREPDA